MHGRTRGRSYDHRIQMSPINRTGDRKYPIGYARRATRPTIERGLPGSGRDAQQSERNQRPSSPRFAADARNAPSTASVICDVFASPPRSRVRTRPSTRTVSIASITASSHIGYPT